MHHQEREILKQFFSSTDDAFEDFGASADWNNQPIL
jgi:hypothetical protein